MEASKSKSTSFISRLAKQTYLKSNWIFFSIGVETNRGNRWKKIGLGRKVYRRRRHCIEAGRCQRCGKIGHKKNSCLKMYLELISNQYTLLEKEAPPIPPKKRLCSDQSRPLSESRVFGKLTNVRSEGILLRWTGIQRELRLRWPDFYIIWSIRSRCDLFRWVEGQLSIVWVRSRLIIWSGAGLYFIELGVNSVFSLRWVHIFVRSGVDKLLDPKWAYSRKST